MYIYIYIYISIFIYIYIYIYVHLCVCIRRPPAVARAGTTTNLPIPSTAISCWLLMAD